MSSESSGTAGEVLVVGSANMDFNMRVPALPAAGQTVLGDGVESGPGGKGANQAVAAAFSGARVRMVACVGADSHGQTVRASLAAAGVDTALVRTDNERETGVAVVLVAPNGENAIAVSPGANHALVAADVREVAAGLGPADVLLTQLEIPQRVVVDAIDAAAGAGSRTVLNLAPAMSVPSDTLGQLDVLIVNRSEAEFLLGRALPGLDVCRAGAAELHTRGPAAVILTMGADGAIIADSTGARHVPALKAEVVDTAGAGDAFVGAFCAALAAGRPLDDAVAAAARAAAAAVSSPGAQLSARDNHGRRDNR